MEKKAAYDAKKGKEDATPKRTTRTAAAAAAAAAATTTGAGVEAAAPVPVDVTTKRKTRAAAQSAKEAPAPDPVDPLFDPLWADEEEANEAEAYVDNEDEEEDDEEEFVEEQRTKKRKTTAKSTAPKSSGKKEGKALKKETKEPQECWPERKVWARPETLKQMMDVTTRGKVQALEKPMEILQYATLPYARTDKYEQEKATAAGTTGAAREQAGWP